MKRLLVAGLLAAVGLSATAAFASSNWQVVQNPAPGQLSAAVVTAPGAAWAAGYTSAGHGPYRALLERFAGGAWRVSPSAPVPSSHTTFLYGVAAAGPRDVWAVGSDTNPSFTNTQGLAEHWNGTAWLRTAVATGEPAGSTLVAVGADRSADAWAVGYSHNPSTLWNSPLIEHWDGSKWSVVAGASAYPSSPYNRLETVAVLSPTDVWALGVTGRHPDPVFEHFNGTSWSIVPQPAGGYDTFLDAISARAADDIWAVGGTEVTNTLIEHWDGSSWRIVPSPNVTGPGSVLNTLTGVSALGAGDVWAVGQTLTNGSSASTLAEHWNGSSWTISPTPSPPPSSSLNAVSGLPGGPLIAVGTLILQR